MAGTLDFGPQSRDFYNWYQTTKTGRPKSHRKNKSEFKAKRTAFRQIASSATGDIYKLPEHDYKELVEYFNKHKSELSDTYKTNKGYYRIQTPGDLLDYAFESERQQKTHCEVAVVPDTGDHASHIKKITYNAQYMVMRVEFTNKGDICAFFNVDADTAARLLTYAENGTMGVSSVDGRKRHMVGIEFWNLVRVRGTLHDTRFPFQYTTEIEDERPVGRPTGSYKQSTSSHADNIAKDNIHKSNARKTNWLDGKKNWGYDELDEWGFDQKFSDWSKKLEELGKRQSKFSNTGVHTKAEESLEVLRDVYNNFINEDVDEDDIEDLANIINTYNLE